MVGIVDQLRSTRSLADAAFKATQAALDTLFGFRADTAEAIARKLFTADRRELDQLLLRLEGRMGPDRAAQFRQFMAEFQASTSQTAAAATAPRPEGPPPVPTAPAPSPPAPRPRSEQFDRPPNYLPPDPKPMPPPWQR